MHYLANGQYIRDVSAAETALTGTLERKGDVLVCRVENTGSLPAFRVALRSGTMDCDLRYSDNCFWLDPGEIREISISSFDGLPEQITLNAWNASSFVCFRNDAEL